MFKTDAFLGKHVLVTGGGSGLGFAMAKRLAELGARISLCGRSRERLDEAASNLTEQGLKEPYLYQCDVREFDAVHEMIEAAVASHGHLDAVINNAAGNFYSCSEDLSPNGFRSVVEIVLFGTFNCSHAFGNYLIREGRGGSILNIVTTYTQTGSAFVLPSACGKAGVAALTRTLGYEWAEYGIRVNGIAPGPFPTPGAWARLMPNSELEEEYRKRLPTGRFGEKEELANLAVFLLSDLCPYITGEIVAIDGAEGLRAGSFNFLSEVLPRDQLKAAFQGIRKSK